MYFIRNNGVNLDDDSVKKKRKKENLNGPYIRARLGLQGPNWIFSATPVRWGGGGQNSVPS